MCRTSWPTPKTIILSVTLVPCAVCSLPTITCELACARAPPPSCAPRPPYPYNQDWADPTKVLAARMSANASGPGPSCLGASGPEPICVRVELASFGFSHKAPEGVGPDSIFDLRALPNPKSYATRGPEPRTSRCTHTQAGLQLTRVSLRLGQEPRVQALDGRGRWAAAGHIRDRARSAHLRSLRLLGRRSRWACAEPRYGLSPPVNPNPHAHPNPNPNPRYGLSPPLRRMQVRPAPLRLSLGPKP